MLFVFSLDCYLSASRRLLGLALHSRASALAHFSIAACLSSCKHGSDVCCACSRLLKVRILSTLNRELLKPSASVALHRHSNALVDILPPEADSSISLLDQSERPDVSYSVRGQ